MSQDDEPHDEEIAVAKEQTKLKLGKSAAFVKTHLKRLKQENDTWEADFRALPKLTGQTETHYLGLVVALPNGKPRTLAEAMAALERGLARWFKSNKIEEI